MLTTVSDGRGSSQYETVRATPELEGVDNIGQDSYLGKYFRNKLWCCVAIHPTSGTQDSTM
jgi:hypothetical protein